MNGGGGGGGGVGVRAVSEDSAALSGGGGVPARETETHGGEGQGGVVDGGGLVGRSEAASNQALAATPASSELPGMVVASSNHFI